MRVVAFMSLNLGCHHRVCVVYYSFGKFVILMCDSYVCVVLRRCNFDVRLVRFRGRGYEFYLK